MTRPNPDLIAALRATAARLEGGAHYRWTQMGSCNCGHLAQTLTRRAPAEIHRAAVERASSWAMTPVDDWADDAGWSGEMGSIMAGLLEAESFGLTALGSGI